MSLGLRALSSDFSVMAGSLVGLRRAARAGILVAVEPTPINEE